MLVTILVNALVIVSLVAIWLVKRGLDQQDVLKDIQSENVTYQENISGKMIEFREHLATIMGSGFYDDDENLQLLMKHANYMIEFLEGLDRGIKIEFLEESLEGSKAEFLERAKKESKVRTVAHFSSERDGESKESEEVGQ